MQKMKKKTPKGVVNGDADNDISDYDSVIEDDNNSFTEEKAPNAIKKKRKASKENANNKKFKSSKLTKQPTTEELNRLRETENLFNSNFFRLQIEEVLKEMTVKPKYVSRFNTWLQEFNKYLSGLDNTEDVKISDQSWLDDTNVKISIAQKPFDTKGYFKFIKCQPAVIVGSHTYKCNLGPNLTIDLKIEMPKDVFQKADYLNERYHRKRALYIAYLASKLNESNLVENLKYKLFNESNFKPILTFNPICKAGNNIDVLLHFGLEENAFKISRFSPSINNVREGWRFENDEIKESDFSAPTPFYNSAILIDLTYSINNKFLSDSLKDFDNIKEGILLLKIWLKQRQIYTFSGFIMSMFIAYLISIRRINNAMSSYQVIRNVWSALATSDWDKNGLSVANSDSNTKFPVVQEFHTHFPVVFIDHSGYNNICAHLSLGVYNAVKYESELAVKFLDNANINGFSSLFMTPVNFNFKYDHILRLNYSKKLESTILERISDNIKLDCGSDKYHTIQKYLYDLFIKGLGDRVSLITPKCLSDEERIWPIDVGIKKGNPLRKCLVFGIKLNPDHAFSFVDRGPAANLPEAERYREFWGNKSELRRFQDGSISEACLWETTSTMAAKRLVVKKIIFFLLQEKLGIEKKIFYFAEQFEFLLHNKRFQPANFDFGTGEEAALKVSVALDGLMKNLRSLTEMPLEVNSMHGLSPVFSYTDPAPPLAYAPPNSKGFVLSGKYRLIPEEIKLAPGKRTQRSELFCPLYTQALKVVIQLTHSGKWPDDLDTLRKIKAAFYIQIADALVHQCKLTAYPRQDYLDVFKDGYVFRLEIAHQKEISLMKKVVDDEGVTKYRDTDESIDVEYRLLYLPRVRVALNGLYHHHQCFGPASCLAKRWMRAHMIDSFHFPEICIDMLVASVFLNPEPYEVPIQPQVAFWRFLKLLATADWNTQMILLNFNNDLEKEELIEIESNFSASRSSLPAFYCVTPYEDKKNSMWTRNAPSNKILARVQILAAESLNLINNVVFENFSNDVDIIFKSNMNGYDVLIHLKKNFNPLSYLNIKNNSEKLITEKLNPYVKNDNEFIPVADFNPVQIYLEQLRSSYDDFALFFHDTYGGDVIGVLWKPPALEYKEFKTSTASGRKPTKKDGKLGVIADLDAILEGFCIIGEGLIANIENISNVSV